jgi:hypothetical protein
MGVKLGLWPYGTSMLRVFESTALRIMFGQTRTEVAGGKDCITRSFITCILYQVKSE